MNRVRNDMPDPAPRNEGGPVAVRPIGPGDSLEHITALLHRAYAKQVAMGLRPLAGRQDVQTTKRRIGSGECFVGVHGDNRVLGVILFQELEDADFPPWFERPGVSHFSLLAVEPSVQSRGVGAALIGAVERRALALGFEELALSMAEPDTELRAYYDRRGFRFIEHWRWPYTNYRSVILSKQLRGS